MARIPVSELSRYLLRGLLHHPSCLRLSRNYRPVSSPASNRRHFSLSFTRLQEGEVLGGGLRVEDPRHVPLRKQLKAEEKALKASGHKRTGNASRQVVPGWELTVGIEIHAQLNTGHKLFSAAAPPLLTDDPNTRVALFDLAMPGSQPIFQTEALIPAVRAALALNCDVQRVSRWDRKHYFWWDQPSGYQITQYHEPFAREGHMILYKSDGIADEDGDSVRVGIQQIQMEQDTGKTLARPDGVQYVDFNRVGVPLIEIITKPEIHHPKTAAALVRKIQTYLNSVDACVSGMEAGGLRADVNVSVRSTDQVLLDAKPLGQRTEIKNLSSFKAVEDAIIAERDRQIAVLEQGGVIAGETRGWSIGGTETTRLRGKEGEVDYRYMPDPDLGPVIISEDVVSHLYENLGDLPDQELEDLVLEYGLRTKDARSLMQLDGGGRLEYFYDVIKRLQKRSEWTQSCGVLAANWVLNELGRLTSERNASADGVVESLGMAPSGECTRVPAQHLADIVYFLHTGRISSRVAKELLFAVFRGDLSGANPDGYSTVEQAIDKEGLWFQKLSEEQYEKLAIQVLEDEKGILMHKFEPHFSKGKKYPEGQLMFLVGKMMRSGPAEQMEAKDAQETLRRLIEEQFRNPW